MDFGLSEEQMMLQETIRAFVANECPTTRLRELFDVGTGHDPEIWSALSEMGIAGLVVAEAYGGAGLRLLDLALVAEVFGEAALPSPFLGHWLATMAVGLAADEAQRAQILPPLASGEKRATVAFQEGDQGWAIKDWTLRIEADRISGVKQV